MAERAALTDGMTRDARGRGAGRGLARTPAAETEAETATSPLLLAIFVLVLLVPIQFEVAGIRLAPARAFLLLAFVPLFLRWIGGAAGRVAPGDVLIGLHCLWIWLAFLTVHGPAQIPLAGALVLELFGGYLAGRVLVRNATDYRLVFRYILTALALLVPFILVEMLTGRMPISEILGKIGSTYPKAHGGGPRMGFVRAQGVFEHPILFGLFCSIAIANVIFIFRSSMAVKILLSGFVTAMTFASLSSAALLSAGLQYGLMLWGWVTRKAWWILIILGAIAYVVVDALSNRTPVTILISYLTFSADTAWNRIHIWNYGIQEVWRNPVFGIGLNDWRRAYWMTESVDNFWLVTAMRYGIPAFLLLAGGIVLNLLQILRQRLPEELARYREGHVIAAAGLFMTLSTVHIWGPVSVFVMFYLGAASWLFTGTAARPAPVPARAEPRRASARPAREAAPSGERPGTVEGMVAGRPGRRPGRGPTPETLARRRAAYGARRS